jgi:hypothetical protein
MTHKLIVLFSLLSWLILAQFSAPNATGSEYTPGLWKIVETKSNVHLFDSVHIGKSDMYPRPAPERESIDTGTHSLKSVPVQAKINRYRSVPRGVTDAQSPSALKRAQGRTSKAVSNKSRSNF